jgi:hypothetical protein
MVTIDAHCPPLSCPTFRPFLDDFLIVYLDDIIIFSGTWDEHVRHVKQVLDTLQRENLYVKLSKCEFEKITLI